MPYKDVLDVDMERPQIHSVAGSFAGGSLSKAISLFWDVALGESAYTPSSETLAPEGACAQDRKGGVEDA